MGSCTSKLGLDLGLGLGLDFSVDLTKVHDNLRKIILEYIGKEQCVVIMQDWHYVFMGPDSDIKLRESILRKLCDSSVLNQADNVIQYAKKINKYHELDNKQFLQLSDDTCFQVLRANFSDARFIGVRNITVTFLSFGRWSLGSQDGF